MYFKIITFLIVVMVMYYAVMIILDIRAQKAKAAADAEKDSEVDIDISDEASSFKPTLISREEKAPVQADSRNDEDSNDESSPDTEDKSTLETSEGEADFSEENKPSDDSVAEGSAPAENPQEDKKPFRHPYYREAIMTGGYMVEDLIEEIDKEAEDKDSDLAQVIHAWERA